MKKPDLYVNNKELYAALVKYNEAKLKVVTVKVPEYVGKCILLITSRLSTRGNFANYSYRDEMVADAIENCLAAVDNFNVHKYTNPHAYFTKIAWFAFLRRIDKEKRQNYLKYKNYRKHLDEEQLQNYNLNNYNWQASEDDDVMNDVISNYEESIQRKKKKKKEKDGVDRFIVED